MDIGFFFRAVGTEADTLLQYNADNPGAIEAELNDSGEDVQVGLSQDGDGVLTLEYKVSGVDDDDFDDLKDFFEDIL